FAPAITLASDATAGLAAQFAGLHDVWAHRVVAARAAGGRRRPRSDSAVSASLEVLADMPAFRARDLAERLGVTWRAAQDAIAELMDAGIVRQVSAGRGNRLYEA